ncbi:MAG: hypothetical protein ACTSUE_11555 [Promethearchaeota archaeon]
MVIKTSLHSLEDRFPPPWSPGSGPVSITRTKDEGWNPGCMI